MANRSPPPGAPEEAQPTVVRDGVVVRRSSEGLHLRITDYHAGPGVYLNREDLQRLGLRAAGGDEAYGSTRALGWSHRRALLEAQKAPEGAPPGFEEPSPPRGFTGSGFKVFRVRGGLDVFVREYHAIPLIIDLETLRALGLLDTEE